MNNNKKKKTDADAKSCCDLPRWQHHFFIVPVFVPLCKLVPVFVALVDVCHVLCTGNCARHWEWSSESHMWTLKPHGVYIPPGQRKSLLFGNGSDSHFHHSTIITFWPYLVFALFSTQLLV
jgi:hypothetical protein